MFRMDLRVLNIILAYICLCILVALSFLSDIHGKQPMENKKPKYSEGEDMDHMRIVFLGKGSVACVLYKDSISCIPTSLIVIPSDEPEKEQNTKILGELEKTITLKGGR